jgi:hypothetical protein
MTRRFGCSPRIRVGVSDRFDVVLGASPLKFAVAFRLQRNESGIEKNFKTEWLSRLPAAESQAEQASVDQSLKGDCLFPSVNGYRGVAVVDIVALTGDPPEYRVPFDDVHRKPFGGRKYSENDVVRLNDGLQGPGLIVGCANEITGLGGELAQLFELSHLNTPTQLTLRESHNILTET